MGQNAMPSLYVERSDTARMSSPVPNASDSIKYQRMDIGGQATFLYGSLKDFPLTDIIQLFEISDKVGELRVVDESTNATASLFFDRGIIVHVICADDVGEDALGNVIRWKHGTFSFLSGSISAEISINRPVQAVLLDTLTRIDNLTQVESQLPSGEVRLTLSPDPEEMPEISLPEWRVLALVNGRRTINQICRKQEDELMTKQIIVNLMQKGLLTRQTEEATWRLIFPQTVPASDVTINRPIPPRLRTNLLLKKIDGTMNLLELRLSLNMSEEDLLEDVNLLLETQWIRFDGKAGQLFKELFANQ
jgi:hypothetical protein